MALAWRSMSADQELPSNSIVGGREENRTPLYIIRAKFENCLLPGKFSSARQQAYISFDGREHEIVDFEILTGTRFEWLKSNETHYVSRDFPAGYDENGEILNIGRIEHDDAVTLGKIVPTSH